MQENNFSENFNPKANKLTKTYNYQHLKRSQMMIEEIKEKGFDSFAEQYIVTFMKYYNMDINEINEILKKAKADKLKLSAGEYNIIQLFVSKPASIVYRNEFIRNMVKVSQEFLDYISELENMKEVSQMKIKDMTYTEWEELKRKETMDNIKKLSLKLINIDDKT